MSFPAAFFGVTIFGIYFIHHTSSALFKTSVLYPNILARLDALPKPPHPTPYHRPTPTNHHHHSTYSNIIILMTTGPRPRNYLCKGTSGVNHNSSHSAVVFSTISNERGLIKREHGVAWLDICNMHTILLSSIPGNNPHVILPTGSSCHPILIISQDGRKRSPHMGHLYLYIA
jgi:hypothetical protein